MCVLLKHQTLYNLFKDGDGRRYRLGGHATHIHDTIPAELTSRTKKQGGSEPKRVSNVRSGALANSK